MARKLDDVLDYEDEDFCGFIAVLRQVDITEFLGGDRKGDPKMLG